MKNNISYIIPTFNSEKYVAECINSIFDGNFSKGDEIIIIDDVSTDNTLQEVLKLKKKHKNIKIIKHKINKGTAAAARNTGIESASNELIFCLDSDNVLQKNSINKLVTKMIKEKADAICFGEIHFFKKSIKNVTHKWVFKNGIIRLNDALAGSIGPGSSGNYLFTKNSWIKSGRYFEPSLLNQTLDSWIFATRQLGIGIKFYGLKNSFYYHRYGYRSHYVREEKRGNRSLAALIGILPFIEKLDRKSLEYIFSKKYRYSWYSKLNSRPLKLKNYAIGENGKHVSCKKGVKSIYSQNILIKIINIKNLLWKK